MVTTCVLSEVRNACLYFIPPIFRFEGFLFNISNAVVCLNILALAYSHWEMRVVCG
jgi:hypothetical protein